MDVCHLLVRDRAAPVAFEVNSFYRTNTVSVCFHCSAHAGTVTAVGVIVDRSGKTKPDFGCPFVSLVEMNVENFAAEKLPPDLAKITAVKPGSK